MMNLIRGQNKTGLLVKADSSTIPGSHTYLYITLIPFDLKRNIVIIHYSSSLRSNEAGNYMIQSNTIFYLTKISVLLIE